jgi:hypothetical protein
MYSFCYVITKNLNAECIPRTKMLVEGILNAMQCIGSADLNSNEFAPSFEKDMQS